MNVALYPRDDAQQTQTDRQKAMPKSPPCLSTGGLKEVNNSGWPHSGFIKDKKFHKFIQVMNKCCSLDPLISLRDFAWASIVSLTGKAVKTYIYRLQLKWVMT